MFDSGVVVLIWFSVSAPTVKNPQWLKLLKDPPSPKPSSHNSSQLQSYFSDDENCSAEIPGSCSAGLQKEKLIPESQAGWEHSWHSPERYAIGSYKKATKELIEKCKAMIAEFEIEPIEAVAESINSRVLTRFSNGLVTHGTAVEATGPTSTADTFPSLRDAAQDIIDQVEDVASKSNLSHSQLKWKVDCNGGPLKVSHLLALRDWLLTCDLMVANIQRKPAPIEKKVLAKAKAIKILVDGKLVTMDATMCIDARRDASMYPGCIENGMEPVKEVLTNRAMAARPDPEEHQFLKDCKCPLSGAALELWMLKMTGNFEDIPQRSDDQLANHRLSLNPKILKVIGSAIKAASGHDIDTLLTPEID
ncbi:hypothetical protein C8R44DRAFT_920916 [Mycena epipterygia]|nr:hypothetical protein C8R44DRAFT_920916 [Mycena epipterygia]